MPFAVNQVTVTFKPFLHAIDLVSDFSKFKKDKLPNMPASTGEIDKNQPSKNTLLQSSTTLNFYGVA